MYAQEEAFKKSADFALSTSTVLSGVCLVSGNTISSTFLCHSALISSIFRCGTVQHCLRTRAGRLLNSDVTFIYPSFLAKSEWNIVNGVLCGALAASLHFALKSCPKVLQVCAFAATESV